MKTVSMKTTVFNSSWQDYLELCKPKVVLLMIITSIVGMCLSSPTFPPLSVVLFGNLGIALAAGASAAINHLADYRIDSIMARTQGRPVVQGKVSALETLLFASILTIVALSVLVIFVNSLTAVLTFLSMIGYAGVYTFYLKHNTSQNIVIGGLAGAAPPLLGAVAVTGHVTLMGLMLMAIIFIWTPPHFWALAIDRVDEYAQANVPMLPNTHGIPHTKRCIVIYTLALLCVSIAPTVFGCANLFYLFSALILGLWFLFHTVKLYRDKNNSCAITVFKISIAYLFLIFIALLVDHYLTYFLY